MIELRQVVKKFGPFTAVDCLNLYVDHGAFFGFLGPNGAGKTTTIKMLTGLLAPTSGTCLINGFDIQRQPLEAKRSFGYVPDQPYIYERLSGREFLLFIGGLFKLPVDVIQTRIALLTAQFAMETFIDRRADEYSLGMRQRVVLSAALLHDPQVLIIDEPLMGLDPRSARIVKDTLKQKTADGMTIFMSTHLLEIVEELCDRLAIIKDGRIIHEEPAVEPGRLRGQLEHLFLDLTR